MPRFTFLVIGVTALVCMSQLTKSAPSNDFKCYSCFPELRLNQCNEPQDSQLVSCPAGVCWMTMKENSIKVRIVVSRGCGKAMEAPGLSVDDCKKTRDRSSGQTEQICNCNAPRCNRNNCRTKSKCFL
ncbi:uncharacterized protein LOC129601342 [Paramacrobiotus metropolitanus]|uniref:uncharacterized protein LOC129601342 n=1 Tax=Paramacrobiotus metropolitanus TaxID=2943436 RepID=UPI0024456210|nr:uncharacterized protein LOC129601342 [Paramacrobiotus metropolitanus]